MVISSMFNGKSLNIETIYCGFGSRVNAPAMLDKDDLMCKLISLELLKIKDNCEQASDLYLKNEKSFILLSGQYIHHVVHLLSNRR